MADGSSQTPNGCKPSGSWALAIAACLFVAAMVPACDDSFEPTAPTELAFSVFGYLDGWADTQWIRIMPVRPLKVTSPGALAATVTLEHLGTGRIIDLRDSLFKFSSYFDSVLGSEGTYVHNFWTPEEIEPGTAYRLSARRGGKEPAEAVVKIPGDYEVEVGINQLPTQWPPDSLRITGVNYVPFLSVIAHFYDLCGSSVTSGPRRRRSADDTVFLLKIGKPEVMPRTGCGEPVVETWEIRMVGSEAPWPAGEGYAPGGLGASGRTSNLTNAVGFLGGVLTRVIPYERCEFQSDGTLAPVYCWLRYTPETATVTGTVTVCRGAPRSGVMVQLTEMNREPTRIRTAFSDLFGTFLIGALEPAIPHLLVAGDPIHGSQTDTLTFMPGQRLEYDIDLPCGQSPQRAQ